MRAFFTRAHSCLFLFRFASNDLGAGPSAGTRDTKLTVPQLANLILAPIPLTVPGDVMMCLVHVLSQALPDAGPPAGTRDTTSAGRADTWEGRGLLSGDAASRLDSRGLGQIRRRIGVRDSIGWHHDLKSAVRRRYGRPPSPNPWPCATIWFLIAYLRFLT